MTQAPPRVVWVYAAHSPARIAEEEAFVQRMVAAGADVRAFGIPCPEGWWPFPVLDQRYRKGDRALHEAYAALARELDSADALVAAGGAMLHPAFVDQLRVRKLFLCADDPESSANLSRPVAPHFDHCFVVNIACVDDYRAWGCKSAEWLFPVLRPERCASGITQQQILRGARDLDLALCCDRDFGIGDRKDRLAGLLAAFPQVRTYGRGWPGGQVDPPAVASIYARTKIGWNLHHSIGPCNTRLLELPANGVLQICDNRAQLGRIFDLDREVVGFDTVAECIDLTRYYLAHDDERRRIAAAGWQRVQRDYTEARQWERIEAAARGVTAPPPPPVARPRAAPSIAVIPARRPKVWLLADRRGCAHDREAMAMTQALAADFECRVAYVEDQPDLGAWDFDLVWVLFWGEIYHQQFVSDARRVIKLVDDHAWQHADAWGRLDPETFVATHLRDAATLAATSWQLAALIQPFRSVLCTPQGIDPQGFHPGERAPEGDLRVGWVGDRHAARQGLADIVQPACGTRWTLRTAGRDCAPAARADFYRELDVLCVASTAAGEPLPLLEALACGAFVITTDVGIAREVIGPCGDDLDCDLVRGLVVERTPAAFRAALHWCDANVAHLRHGRRERAGKLHAQRSPAQATTAHRSVLRQALRARRVGSDTGLAAPALAAAPLGLGVGR